MIHYLYSKYLSLLYKITEAWKKGEIPTFCSIHQLGVFCSEEIQYNHETYDYIQNPITTWERHAGDCDDIALFATFQIKAMGEIGYYIEMRKHAIAALYYAPQNQWGYIDTQGLWLPSVKGVCGSLTSMLNFAFQDEKRATVRNERFEVVEYLDLRRNK